MQPMNRAEKTLVHNDCNPRNICVRLSSESVPLDESVIPFNDPRSLCIYDWEMARVDVPQRDVVEFLAFTLPPDTSVTKRRELINFYRAHLEHYTGKSFPIERYVLLSQAISWLILDVLFLLYHYSIFDRFFTRP